MNAVTTTLLLLAVSLALVMSLMSALQKLKPEDLQSYLDRRALDPQFRDHSAGEHSGDQQAARSQFAWQSRSHSQPPD